MLATRSEVRRAFAAGQELVARWVAVPVAAPARDSTSNILAATPEWDRMPTPIKDTLAIDSVTATDRASTSLASR